MTEVRDIAKIFDRTEYAKWRSFRESEDSRYVGLTLPHVLMREPYGAATRPTETFGSKRTSMARTTRNIFGEMPPMRWARG